MAAPSAQEQAFQHLLGACRAKHEAGVLTSWEVAVVERGRDALLAAELVDAATIAAVTQKDMVESHVPLGVAAVLKKAFPGRQGLSCRACAWAGVANSLPQAASVSIAGVQAHVDTAVTMIVTCTSPIKD
jgi:hypothetical protein